MIVTLILERKEKLLNLCQETLREDIVKIRFLSKPMGNLESFFPAVTCFTTLSNEAKKFPTFNIFMCLTQTLLFRLIQIH